MADIVDKATRSRIMSNIRGKNTKLEVLLRKELFSRGYRYRLHDRRLPGKPDIVLPRFKAVIFVNGCFWHGHDCGLFREPKSNAAFWRNKIICNRINDSKNLECLAESGWRALTVWECSVRIRRHSVPELADMVVEWLYSGKLAGEIRC